MSKDGSELIASWLNAVREVLQAELGPEVELTSGGTSGQEAQALALVAEVAGDWSGSFEVAADLAALAGILKAAPEAARERWQGIFRKSVMAAAERLSASSGHPCEIAMISDGDAAAKQGSGYQLRSGDGIVLLRVVDRVKLEEAFPPNPRPVREKEAPLAAPREAFDTAGAKSAELLLDVELEASLRFGAREMSLNEILELGPGDVVQLDRHVDDPVDLIVGDKIVARGEVVLVNGNFGLQILEVAEPRRRLESIRCLF